jgi:hypothetical protein
MESYFVDEPVAMEAPLRHFPVQGFVQVGARNLAIHGQSQAQVRERLLQELHLTPDQLLGDEIIFQEENRFCYTLLRVPGEEILLATFHVHRQIRC